MARRAQLQVTGDKALVANFYATNERVGHYLRSVNRRMARQVENLARDLAPIDTGRLKRSITHSMSPDELVFDVYPDPVVFQEDGEPYYPIWVEFGNSNPNYPAQPFLNPAFQAMLPHYEADIRRGIMTALREVSR